MTTWSWAALPAGSYDLPAPALVMSPWVLTARESRPTRCGFRHIPRPSSWPKVKPGRAGLVIDFRTTNGPMFSRADDPSAVDYNAIRNMEPGRYESGAVRWTIPVFTQPGQRDISEVFEQAHDSGRVWLLTGELPVYWAAARSGARPSFDQLFPDGTWAASVPLSTHLFTDGVGTRPGQSDI
jgi:hypothetical protein